MGYFDDEIEEEEEDFGEERDEDSEEEETLHELETDEYGHPVHRRPYDEEYAEEL